MRSLCGWPTHHVEGLARAVRIVQLASLIQADHFRAKLSLANETVLFSRNEDDKNHGAVACRCRIRLHSEHSRNSFLSCPGKPNLTWHWQAVVDSRQAISVLLFLLWTLPAFHEVVDVRGGLHLALMCWDMLRYWGGDVLQHSLLPREAMQPKLQWWTRSLKHLDQETPNNYLGPSGIFSDCRLSCPMREQMTTSELATYLSAAWQNKRVKRLKGCKEKS